MRSFVKKHLAYIILYFIISGCHACNEDQNTVPITIGREDPVNGVRIAWDYATLKKLSTPSARYSGYARMIRLTKGSLYCVYESDGKILGIESFDDGDTWTDPVNIAEPENGISTAVPEILQLADESMLVSYNMRPTAPVAVSKKFGIRVRRSIDGNDWSEAVTVYEAGHEFSNGCWEPAQIQLPSGEIQLFIANEGPYTSSNEQEITMFRSEDNGASWYEGEKVSFRDGHRDGMPVPLILEDQQEIIFVIEDNGISPTEFKPALIRTSLTDNWNNAPVTGKSPHREQPFDKFNLIPGYKYAGAPYIRKLKSGEVIMSYQSNEFRSDNVWDRSDMIVSIGNNEGRIFNRKSKPFYFTDPLKSCLWNSLAIIDEKTVVAVGSTNAYGNNTEVWMIKGHILPVIESRKLSVTVDGEKNENIWNDSVQIFIGGYGTTTLTIKTAWDELNLYVLAEVYDKQVIEGSNTAANDGFRIYIDPENRSTTIPDVGIFSLDVAPSGQINLREGTGGDWKLKEADGIDVKSKLTQSGYQVEIAVPWNALGGMPGVEKRIGFHTSLIESSTARSYEEPLSGNLNNVPYTWSPMFLKE
jgi:hypothetical protein